MLSNFNTSELLGGQYGSIPEPLSKEVIKKLARENEDEDWKHPLRMLKHKCKFALIGAVFVLLISLILILIYFDIICNLCAK